MTVIIRVSPRPFLPALETWRFRRRQTMQAAREPANATTAIAIIAYVSVDDEDEPVGVEDGGDDVSTAPALSIGADDMAVEDMGIAVRVGAVVVAGKIVG